jgi:hypothetical protein
MPRLFVMPTFDLNRHLLGIRPVEPGWGRVAVEPRFGPLSWLSCEVPTPRGRSPASSRQQAVAGSLRPRAFRAYGDLASRWAGLSISGPG